MNPRKNHLGFLGRSWSAPIKLMGESTIFVKNAIGGFGGPKGGWHGGETVRVCGGPPSGWMGGRVEEDDEMLNISGWIWGIPLSLCGLWKWSSLRNSWVLGEDLNAHWNGDFESISSSLHQFWKKCTSAKVHIVTSLTFVHHRVLRTYGSMDLCTCGPTYLQSCAPKFLRNS